MSLHSSLLAFSGLACACFVTDLAFTSTSNELMNLLLAMRREVSNSRPRTTEFISYCEWCVRIRYTLVMMVQRETWCRVCRASKHVAQNTKGMKLKWRCENPSKERIGNRSHDGKMNRSQDRNAGPGTEAAGRWFSAKLDCVTVRATTRPSAPSVESMHECPSEATADAHVKMWMSQKGKRIQGKTNSRKPSKLNFRKRNPHHFLAVYCVDR